MTDRVNNLQFKTVTFWVIGLEKYVQMVYRMPYNFIFPAKRTSHGILPTHLETC